MTTPNSREEMRVKIINILSYQAGITAQGISYTGEKDWALNKLTELLHQELQKARIKKIEILDNGAVITIDGNRRLYGFKRMTDPLMYEYDLSELDQDNK